jgi:glycine cleavage system transcriptional repressor
MQKNIVLTITGPDRIGLVEKVSKIVVEHAGNIEASRMAHLGGEFSMLMLIRIEEDHSGPLEKSLAKLQAESYKLTSTITAKEDPAKYKGWVPYSIEVSGADHEGIINKVAGFLSQTGFNIETINTNTVTAPMSGTELFTMDAIFLVPAERTFSKWNKPLQQLGDELNVEIEVAPYKG